MSTSDLLCTAVLVFLFVIGIPVGVPKAQRLIAKCKMAWHKIVREVGIVRYRRLWRWLRRTVQIKYVAIRLWIRM